MVSEFLLIRAEIHQKRLHTATPQFGRRLPGIWLKDVQVTERELQQSLAPAGERQNHPRNQGYNLSKCVKSSLRFGDQTLSQEKRHPM